MADQLVTQVHDPDEDTSTTAYEEEDEIQVGAYPNRRNGNGSGAGGAHVGGNMPVGCWRTFMSYFGFGRGKSQPQPLPITAVPSSASTSSYTAPTFSPVASPVPRPLHSTTFNRYLLPPRADPQSTRHKKCLVLDLDETLVHSSFKPIPNPDFVLAIELEGVTHQVYVRKRPGVDYFLKQVAKRWEVVIFTASLAKYADPLLDILDKHKVITSRLFRESCCQHYGNYVKDLTHLGRPLEHTIIIDNSPFSYLFQPECAVSCTSWFHDKSDLQLYELLPFLDKLADAPNVIPLIAEGKESCQYTFFGNYQGPHPPDIVVPWEAQHQTEQIIQVSVGS